MAKPTKPISLTEFAKEIVHLLEMGFSKGDVSGFFRLAIAGVYPNAPVHYAGKGVKIAKFKDEFYFSKAVRGDPNFENLTTASISQEHAVPVSVLILHWKDNKDKLDDEEWIKKTLDDALHVCIITKDEDEKLNKAGLRSAMPKGWKWIEGADFYARYNAVGIVISEITK